MKSFAEMSAEERKGWLSGEVQGGRLYEKQELSLEKRVLNALRYHGPMTTNELADKASTTIKSLTTWANRNKVGLNEAGIVRHLSPDDRKTRVWFLESQVKPDEPEQPAAPGILGRMRSAQVDAGHAVE